MTETLEPVVAGLISALFCSVLFRKTSISLMTTYLLIITMFCVPLAVGFFADTFFTVREPPSTLGEMRKLHQEGKSNSETAAELNRRNITTADSAAWDERSVSRIRRRVGANRWVQRLGFTSPFSATFAVPLYADEIDRNVLSRPTSGDPEDGASYRSGNWHVFGGYLVFAVALNTILLSTMVWLFNKRWRISQ